MCLYFVADSTEMRENEGKDMQEKVTDTERTRGFAVNGLGLSFVGFKSGLYNFCFGTFSSCLWNLP